MHPIIRTVFQRLALSLVTLFVVSIVIFSAVTMLPGDFAKSILGQAATPETVAAFQREIGLDKPPVTRYVNWIQKVAVGDFGESFASRVGYRRTVSDIIWPRLKNTLFLAAITALTRRHAVMRLHGQSRRVESTGLLCATRIWNS